MKHSLSLAILLTCSCDRSQPEVPQTDAPPQAQRADAPGSSAAEEEQRPSEQQRDTQQAHAPGDQQGSSGERASKPVVSSSPAQGAPPQRSPQGHESRAPKPTADTSAQLTPAHPIAAGRFRVTPGQRFEGTATLLRQQGADGLLKVVVEQAPPAASYLTLLQTPSCAPVGVNLQARPAPQPSMTMPARGEVIGRVELEQRGRTERSIPASVPGLIGSAVVVYAPVPAHGGEVLEPVACTVLAAR